jgi:hypothetical protein
MAKNKSLKVEIIDGELRISIGISNLKKAMETSPDERLTWYKVLDLEAFAKDVVNELLDEDEEGTTPVHRLLDNAFFFAIENGSAGIAEKTGKVGY